MRHGKKIKRIGRGAAHRQATLAAMSTALIRNKRITTTFAKAKALRGYVEPLINRAKSDTVHNRRQVFRRLQDKEAVTVLFDDVAGKIGDRPGGYTRVVKLGRRQGDGAEVAMIELVDYNDVKPDGSGGGRKRKTRRGGRRRSKSSSTPAETTAAAATVAAETTEAEVETEAEAEVEIEADAEGAAVAVEDVATTEAEEADDVAPETAADVAPETAAEEAVDEEETGTAVREVEAEADAPAEVVDTEESAEEAPDAVAEQDQPADKEREVEAKGDNAVEEESDEEDEDTKRD